MVEGFTRGAALAAMGVVMSVSVAQAKQPSAGELLREIQHLQVVGSVLYVAAHPDDENTRLLSWLVGHKGVDATYLSMTRGGGGQNLIGPEQSELLGVIRTGELLAARGIDGASQRFSRMRDFGYSKSPDETLRIWGKAAALSDVVDAVEAVRPDLIITRFATTGRNHGHHTASAILAGEAFKTAKWKAKRLLHNRSHWRIKPDTDTSKWLTLDVGTYDPRTGQSFGEVAGHSRTMHKSQGFGSAPKVGPQMEFFSVEGGAALTPDQDIFEGVDLTWGRFKGTGPLIAALKQAEQGFDPTAPHTVLPHLAQAHALLDSVDDKFWRERKQAEVRRVMQACAGLWITARVDQPAMVPGQTAQVTLTALNRSPAKVSFKAVGPGKPVELTMNTPFTETFQLPTQPDRAPTVPFWLAKPPTTANYVIDDPTLRTLPDLPPDLSLPFEATIEGVQIPLLVPVLYARTDAVLGERIHPLELLPPVTATFAQRGIMLPLGTSATTRVTLRADAGPAKGTVVFTAPEGVQVTPASVAFDLTNAAPEQVVALQLRATKSARPGPLSAQASVGARTWRFQQTRIDYSHLPTRTVLQPAKMQLSPVDLKRGPVQTIGYVPGSGDVVADALRAVGYTVEEIDAGDIAAGNLSRFNAIVMGIRAYNKEPRLMALHAQLMAYVKAGGRLMVQYNTNNRFNPLEGLIGPHPFNISRKRVTDETAKMTPVDPSHPALNTPNQLTDADFAGWVQERGLYFADTWDEKYQPIFSANDAGEDPLQGSTLVARHGEGVFVYTGISFFRQLPAGVPGAYRLLANLLAL